MAHTYLLTIVECTNRILFIYEIDGHGKTSSNKSKTKHKIHDKKKLESQGTKLTRICTIFTLGR